MSFRTSRFWLQRYNKAFARLLTTGGENVPRFKLIAPKDGQHVSSAQQEGVFEVVFVNALMQTANIRLVDGSAHVVPNVPWTELKLLDKK